MVFQRPDNRFKRYLYKNEYERSVFFAQTLQLSLRPTWVG